MIRDARRVDARFNMLDPLTPLTTLRSQCAEDLLTYLLRLERLVSRVPRFFPAHVPTAPGDVPGFERIRQPVRVRTEVSARDRRDSEEVERWVTAGFEAAISRTLAVDDHTGGAATQPVAPERPIDWDGSTAE